MTTNLNEIVSGMRDSFKQAKKKIDDRQLLIPEAIYHAKLQRCAVKKAKSGDLYYIGLAYYILQGEEKGRISYDNSLYLIPEKAEWVMKFFSKFGLDESALLSENAGEIIKQYCEMINQAAPVVEISIKHWTPSNSDEKRTNTYLNKVIEGFDSQDIEIQDENDDLSGKSRKELKEIIFANEEVYGDISPKFIASHSEDEIIEEMRKYLHSDSTGDDNEELRKSVLSLCESQIDSKDYNDEMTIDELTDALRPYTFYTTGDSALTTEETSVLIEIGLEDNIEEEAEIPPPPPPPPVKKAAKKAKKR